MGGVRYYIFYVEGEKAYEYLQGTNYVGLWAMSAIDAKLKVKSYMGDVYIEMVTKRETPATKIGYLY